MEGRRARDIVEEAEARADLLATHLTSVLRSSARIAVLHGPNCRGLARHLATVIKLCRPDTDVFYMDADYAHNTLLPYIAENLDAVIVLSQSLSHLARAATASRLVGLRTLAVTTSVPERVRHAVRGVELIELEPESLHLSTLIASIRVGASLGGAARIERLRRETSFSTVVEDLGRRYGREIDAIRSGFTVVASISMESLAEFLRSRGARALTLAEAASTLPKRALLAYSSSEEHEVLETATRLRAEGSEVAMLRINTDPLTAPIYGIILALKALSGAK